MRSGTCALDILDLFLLVNTPDSAVLDDASSKKFIRHRTIFVVDASLPNPMAANFMTPVQDAVKR